MKQNDILAQQLVHVLDVISDAVVIASPENQILFVNDKFVSFFPGRDKLELINQDIQFVLNYIVERLHHSEGRNRAVLQRFILRSFKSLHPQTFEFQSQDGRQIKYSGQILEDGSRIATFTDESATAALHQQFENACDEAEKLSQAKSAFMAAMSHEVKTPLNAIIGMLDLCVLDNYIGNNEYIQRIQKNAENLLGLINNVLDFTKIEANKVSLSPVTCNIRKLCEDIVESYSAKALQTNTQFLLFVDPNLPLEIEVDDIRLTQVLNNLISNGLKFTDAKHPKLSLFVRYLVNEKQVECCVQDNGIGISEEQQKYIFAGFEQGSTDTHRKFGGTGLGLSICQKISWLMNGSLKVNSELGKGSRFTFSFPIEERAVNLKMNLPSFKNKSILTNDPTIFKCLNLYRGFYHFKTRFLSTLPQTLNENEFICISEIFSPEFLDWINTLATDSLTRVCLIKNTGLDDMPDNNIYRLSSVPFRLTELIDFLSGLKAPQNGTGISDKNVLTHHATSLRNSDSFFFEDITALVVEDNKDNMFVFERQLQKLNVKATFVLSPNDAIVRFKDQAFDVVLSDYQMPSPNGAELIKRFRNIEKLQNRAPCQMFIVSADKTQTCLHDCLSAGANEVLLKPLTLLKLSSLFETAQLLKRDFQEATIHAASPCEDTIYEIEVLKDILGDVSEQELQTFMSQYIVNFSSSVEEMSAAVLQEDWKKLSSLAHSLKSSSLIIGAQALSDTCERLEKACNTNPNTDNDESASVIWPELHTQLNNLRNSLTQDYA